MKNISIVVVTICIALLAFILVRSPKSPTFTNLYNIPEVSIEKMNSKTILFGHQSVGENILDGIKQLGYNLSIKDIYIGTNRDPISKIQDFENKVTSDIDVAMMKFCFVDLPGDISPKQLFSEYVAMVNRVTKKYPNIQFIHITIPLTTKHRGMIVAVKNFIKVALGRKSSVTPNNARVNFNEMIRNKFDSATIFDLASIQSIDGDYKEDNIPALTPSLTYDGGHLNDIGKTLIASQFISFLVNEIQ